MMKGESNVGERRLGGSSTPRLPPSIAEFGSGVRAILRAAMNQSAALNAHWRQSARLEALRGVRRSDGSNGVRSKKAPRWHEARGWRVPVVSTVKVATPQLMLDSTIRK
jgi:hypothetical protein